MFPFEEEISALGFGGKNYVRDWVRTNRPHPNVATFMRRGSAFARAPYSEKMLRSKTREAPFRRATELKAATRSLWHLLTRSHIAKLDLFSADFVDVFVTGDVTKACNAVFQKKGWSSHVWAPEFVERSSFRAAIGMALIIYAFYLHRAYKAGDIDAVITQCADAANLLVLDLEKKSSVKYRQVKAALTVMPRQFALKGAAAKKEKREPVRRYALQLANEGNHRSRRQAVLAIKDLVIAYATTIPGASMSAQQAEKTIDGWLRDMGYTPSASKQGTSASKGSTSSS
ncbi:hypothetical protein RI103_14035 [Paraburkholderia sp. FT54]|uniref:hypothetical protein n=1 Tax=Paraburkholderia sp. FT54 TaxID=3074437 RepID=UPI0028779D76|nr:hypothetical protein [Paraburkholderia sp. FT54]WNC88819.1 hypothetical protein RI103_14035 [Paraburkholderia sp. FT54]